MRNLHSPRRFPVVAMLGSGLFRTSAATSAALHAGDLSHFASAILHDTDPKMTHEHYLRASTLSAAQAYASIIDSYLLLMRRLAR
jgi:hypothetical protein